MLIGICKLTFGLLLDSVGYLKPYSDLPISNSVTNAEEAATYTFKFIPSTSIPVGGTLDIQFPDTYAEGLGIEVSPVCDQFECSLSSRTVTVIFTSYVNAGSNVAISVGKIVNPSTPGGTGLFELTTKYGNYLLDQNLRFGVIGVDKASGELSSCSVSIEIGGSLYAGESTRYEFAFKVNSILPANSWIRFTFPNDGFIIPSYPSCQAVSVNGASLLGDLSCQTSGTIVTLSKFTNSIPAETDLKISINVTNPSKSFSTNYFSIETGRYSTNTIYEKKTDISGVTLSPGKISSVSLSAVDSLAIQSRGKLSLYSLSFTTFNTIPEGGEVWIYFNNNFNMDGARIYQHVSGLTDISLSKQITLVYDAVNDILKVTNFQQFKAGKISFKMQITNSESSGATLPLIIRSIYSDGSTIIDENTTDAIGYVETYTSFGITALYSGETLASVPADGAVLDITFTIVPQVEIPKDGYIEFKIPDTMTVVSGSLVAEVDIPTQDSVFAVAAFDATTRLLKVTILNSYYSFLININNKIRITAGFSAPTLKGYYVLDINTYNKNQELLESNILGLDFDLDSTSITTFQVKPLHILSMYENVFRVTLRNNFILPTGTASASLSTKRAYIDIKIPVYKLAGTINYFKNDLGMGYKKDDYLNCIPESAIDSTLSSGLLTCQILYKPSDSPTSDESILIRVTDFASIPASTTFSFFIASIKYTTAVAPIYTVNIYQKENWTETLLGSTTFTGIAADSTDTPTVSSAVTFSLSSTEVSSDVSFTINSNTDGQTLPLNNDALLIFKNSETSYCLDKIITCKAGATDVPCICFTGLNLILMKPTANIVLTTTSVVISSLTNPTVVPSFADEVRIVTWDKTTANINSFTYTKTIPIQTAGTINESLVVPDTLKLSSVDVIYSINFRTVHSLESGSTISVIFPMVYSLSSSSPAPHCSYISLDADTGTAVTCAISGNELVISNFKAIASSHPIILKLKGVKNPSSGTTSGSFGITTYSKAGRVIDKKLDIAGVTFSGTFESGEVTFDYVKAFPSNLKSFAQFELNFKLENELPKDGTIEVNLPNSLISSVSSLPDCRVSGAINTLKSCTSSGQIIILTMSEDLSSAKSVSLFIEGGTIISLDTSLAISITTKYDGVSLDTTPSANIEDRVFIPSTEATTLVVNYIDFYPQNEGELATYTFSLTPSMDFTSDDDVLIIFPDQYDNSISDDLECWSEELSEYMKCEVEHGRYLRFYNHKGYTKCDTCSLKIYVYGIVNPSIGSDSTDHFTVGIKEEYAYSEVNTQAGTLSFRSPPELVSIWNITTDNQDSSVENNFYFNFTNTQKLPSYSFGGEIWVVYHDEYDIEASNVECISKSTFASGYPICSISHNFVNVTGSNDNFAGELTLSLFYVQNPVKEVIASPISIKTYDRLNKKILDSSYPNLSPFPITYSYPGPVIHINNDQTIILELGTVSPDILISVDDPCALDLTFNPSNDDLYFIPFSPTLTVGESSSSFKIGAPRSLGLKDYYITWSTKGDLESAYYTPVKKTKVSVVKNLDVGITVSEISDLPIGGYSLPVTVTLAAGPDSDLTLKMTLSETAGISIPADITFVTGERVKTFVVDGLEAITIYDSTSSPFISFEVLGNDKEAFIAPQPVLFKVVEASTTLPEVKMITVLNAKKSSCNLKLLTSAPAYVYYAIQLANSEPLDFESIQNQVTPTYSNTNTTYGSFYVGSSLALDEIIDGLRAGTEYTITVYLQSTSRQESEPAYYTFSTKPVNSAASFTVRFNQYFMNSNDKTLSIESLAIVLAVKDWQLIEISEEDIMRTRRLSEYISELNLYLIDNPYTDLQKKPLALVNSLNSKKNLLVELLPTLDTSYTISGKEIALNKCSFKETPTVVDTGDYSSLSILSSINEPGYIYAVLIKSTEDINKPTSIQISNSVTSLNHPAIGLSSYLSSGDESNLIFTGLEALTNYNIYLACGNNYPGEPELQSDEETITINWRTAALPAPKALDLDSGSVLSILLFLNALFLIL